MLTIIVPAKEAWNDSTQEFITTKEQKLCLEHSLVSLSKWEAKYHKPFIGNTQKTQEEILYYIQCMTLTQNVDPVIYSVLGEKELKEINDYISDSRTATWFNERIPSGATQKTPSKSGEQVTSELIYYWMVSFQIPFECQKWHLNRLLTLIRICKIKEGQQNKNGKMSKRDILSQNAAINAARRAKMHSKG